jgi:hypothetical protein
VLKIFAKFFFVVFVVLVIEARTLGMVEAYWTSTAPLEP